ncbi:MAG: nitroreductase family protein [Ruminococcaceae bacterium]|nr:nitroreductase family protein [Oscillospiraceae bacterium]
MNETIKTLTTRRSIRSFCDKPVSREDIDTILQAGLYAPTGRNSRDTLFLVVTDKKLRDKISKMNAAVMGGDSDPFYNAGTVIIVFADRNRTTTVEDGSCAMANLMNAAFSLGIDSCWIHRAKEVFESDSGRELARSLGVPDEYIGIGNCILGYRNCELPEPLPRTQPIIYK